MRIHGYCTPAAGARVGWVMALLVLAAGVGCTTTRTVTIVTEPADARIKINGVDHGVGPVTETFVFRSPSDIYRIEAERKGYRAHSAQLTRDDDRKIIELKLPVQTRDIYLKVEPVPGIIKINGKQVTPTPVAEHTARTLPFTVDARDNWTNYTITAERPNFRPAQINVTWSDTVQFYTLRLEPLRKDLNISSSPTGATVYLDGEAIGTTPLLAPSQPFPVDIDTNEFEPRLLRLEKPGYDPVEVEVSWDDGRTDYELNLHEKQKVVRITTDPPGADVRVEGAQPHSRNGVIVYNLKFPPINEEGELQTYSATVSVEPGEREWEPATFTIGWDAGQDRYHIELKEILTRPLPLLVASMRRTESGWECVPEFITTLAMKDKSEPPGGSQPVLIARPNPGRSIGSMAMAPDGRSLLYTELRGTTSADFTSQIFVVRLDGSNSIDIVTDGRSLDIMPWFTPDGEQMLFSSNRAGRRMQIWSMSATGEPGVTRMTTSESHDLWPSLDSDPKPRLFYQAMVDTRPDPRIFMTPLGTVMQRDLSLLGGMQPRVSPNNTEIVFCAINEETGNRDVYRMSDRGAQPQNLTNSPDSDDCDPVWSRDGRMIAFASNRGTDAEGRRNYDIWVLDLSKPNEPVQVTSNGSLDDNPLFDPRGNGIYFRSNRGGEWGIWRISLK